MEKYDVIRKKIVFGVSWDFVFFILELVKLMREIVFWLGKF